MAKSGKVKHFDDTKKFGFIKPDDGGADLFFHISDCPKGTKSVDREAAVSFDVGEGQRGPKAANIKLL